MGLHRSRVSAGRTPVPSGADGVLSRALGGLPDHARDPLPSGRHQVPRDRRTVDGGGTEAEIRQDLFDTLMLLDERDEPQ